MLKYGSMINLWEVDMSEGRVIKKKAEMRNIALIFMFFGFPLFSTAQESETLGRLVVAYNKSAIQVKERYQDRRDKLDANYVKKLKELELRFKSLGDGVSEAAVQVALDDYAQSPNRAMVSVKDNPRSVEVVKKKMLRSRKTLVAEEKMEKYRLMKQVLKKLNTLKAAYKKKNMLGDVQATQVKLDAIEENALYAEYSALEKEKTSNQKNAKVSKISSLGTTAPLSKALLEIKVVKKNMSKLARDGDYDNQRQDLVLTLKLKSREMTIDYENLRVNIWGFARSVLNKKDMKILIYETFSVAELLRGKEMIHDTEVVVNIYDDHYSAQFGHKFHGYVVDVLNAEGAVICSKTSPKNMEKNTEKIKKNGKGDFFRL